MALGMLLDMVGDSWADRVVVGPTAAGLTAHQLLATARGGAAVLDEAGAGTVCFLDLNGPEFVSTLWSAALAGRPFCPLNYRMAAEQLVPLLDGLDRPMVVGAAQYRALLSGSEVRFVETARFLESARSRALAEPAPGGDVDDGDPAVLLFTSGTTSAPKAVVLTHGNLVAYVLETVEFASAEETDAILVCMPPYHVAGVNSALTNLFSGRRIVHLPNFDARTWLRMVRDESITHAMVVPTMLARIVDELGGGQADAPALRHLAYGGARMPRPVLERALAAFPGVDFVNAYGLTETSSTIAVLGPEDHRLAQGATDAAARDRLGSVGRPVPGVELEIRDGAGAPVEPGAVGELWLRGRQISGNYLGRGSVLDAAGWFPTRDRARLDAEGYLFIEGRADDTIIRGGENIAPAEIEEVLAAHPAVADAAVVGMPDDEWGERITAVVVTRPGTELDEVEVRAFVRGRLRGSRTPDDVVFLDELPYTPTGKLVRRELTAILAPSLAAVPTSRPPAEES